MSEDQPTARCLVRRDGEVRELPADEFDRIGDLRADAGTLVWLALRWPGPDELRLLGEEFEIHPLALEDVQKRRQRPKLDTYDDQQMVVLYEALPRAWTAAEGDDAAAAAAGLCEVHLFAGSGWLVTVQWADSPAVDGGLGRFRRGNGPTGTIGGAVYALFDAAADSYFPVLDTMAERMDALQDRVLSGDDGSDGLREMLAMKRELLELRRVLGPMRDVANSLLRRDLELVDDRVEPYFQDLYDHLVRILDQLDLYRDLLASVLDARLTVTSNALNAIMKRLTAITVLLMVPTLIAGIYGMNFVSMPELAWPLGYPFALALMALVMIAAFAYFRRRDWF